MSDPAFDARKLYTAYAYLDALPESLYQPTIEHPVGELEPRARAVLQLRERLLAGQSPVASELAWPGEPLASAITATLGDLDLPRFCRGEADLTDAVLSSVLSLVGAYEHDVAGVYRSLVLEFRRTQLDADHAPASQPDLDAVRSEAVPRAIALLAAEWTDRVNTWGQISDLFGTLGSLTACGWDLSRGLLRHAGWTEVAELRRQLDAIPKLKDLIRSLGRMQTPEHPAEPSVMERIFCKMRRSSEELREVRTALAPTEIQGVERSGEVSRMLPSEAALLIHPALKLLWHARRAERALLTYRAEGVLTERIPTEAEVLAEPAVITRPPERGPVIVCLDTSGSMAGSPERIAKALTLEAMRVAHAEKRACYLYGFGGPRQVLEHQLSLTPDGLAGLLAFLAMSFHGGTDPSAALLEAVARVGESDWSRADILVVSDGQFQKPSTCDEIERAKRETGLRVHGLLIGESDPRAMATFCDPLHRFGEWAALEDDVR